ncbi:enoyl-CoA hydratase/isomerase family protein [Nocardioides daejeonensis]|uniref:enoyl-CoA hydratase/isomerase family protein n=1 Tax=Nocardioides daejeonensis TaxID=1046556 RepID=UPI00195053A2|nr:enoyl-CoA hydratase/isomerase family protein [Nocardioides daejeonensis]
MAEDDLQAERDGHVMRVWINRPEKRNSLTAGIFSALDSLIAEVENDQRIRVMVIRGREQMLCSGFDLDELAGTVLSGSYGWDGAAIAAPVFARLHAMKKPTICVVEGFATAGGFELMLSCDFAVADENARIGDLHIRRALHGGAGPIYRLPRIVGLRRAKEIVLTGKMVTGSQAERWGLVNEAHPADQLDVAVEGWVDQLADKSPLQMQLSKLTLNQGFEASAEALMALERVAFAVTMQSQDAKEGVAAFLEKRDPQWSGR